MSTTAISESEEMNFSANNLSEAEISNANLTLPIDMQFNDGHLLAVVSFSLLFVFSATGNLTVLVVILRRRRPRSVFYRIDFMLLHLAIADLMVTFLMMPLEIGWAVTVQWRGGDILCRGMAFFRVFGLFLSSFVLVCLAIDRYLAVKFPMQTIASERRGQKMILIAWILSAVCSLPQVFIFKLQTHPDFHWYQQCITFGSFPSKLLELLYNIFGMLMMYAFPFVIIVILYCGILAELFRRTKESSDTYEHTDGLRRSGMGNFAKAKLKTFKMTVCIVVIFFVCWTPYYVMCLWYWIDYSSAQELDQRIQKALFLFACTNSAANPIVYGIFHLKSTFRNPATENRGGYSRESIYQQSVYRCNTRNGNLRGNQARTSPRNNRHGEVYNRDREQQPSPNTSTNNGENRSPTQAHCETFMMTSSVNRNASFKTNPMIVHPASRFNEKSKNVKYTHSPLNSWRNTSNQLVSSYC